MFTLFGNSGTIEPPGYPGGFYGKQKIILRLFAESVKIVILI